MVRRYVSGVFVLNSSLTLLFVYATARAGAVLDSCPGQDVAGIQRCTGVHELSLIFYYVSWSNESRRARDAYDKLAQHYDQHLHFATVDCWHVACNCSGTNRWPHAMQQWPALVAHYGKQLALQYSGQDWSLLALRRFVDKLLRPLARVHNKYEVKKLVMHSDAVVLGLFPQPNRPEYTAFVCAALKWLELDPLQGFGFAVALGSGTDDFLSARDSQSPRMFFIHTKGIDVLEHTKWDSDQLVAWIQAGMKRIFRDLHGYTTPTTMAARLQHGPVLGIFENDITKIRFYTDPSNVLLRLGHCQTKPQFCKSLPHLDSQMAANSSYSPAVPAAKTASADGGLCHRRVYLSWDNMRYYHQVNAQLNSIVLNSYRRRTDGDFLEFYRTNICPRPLKYYDPERKVSVAKYLRKTVDSIRLEGDGRLKHNRTLSIGIFDGGKYRDLLKSLGIGNPLDKRNAITVFIADAKYEQLIVMEDDFSQDALASFVKNYYHNEYPDVHSKVHQPKVNAKQPSARPARRAINVRDLNRDMFLSAVQQQPNRTLVVLFYTPTCALAHVHAHTFVQVAGLLAASEDVAFVRVNTQANDLPWQYRMPDSPNILVVPRGRTRDDRLWPQHVEPSVRNVFAFVVKQLEPADQVRAVLASCKTYSTVARLQKCLHYANDLVVEHTARHLKQWQLHERDRYLLFDRLQELKELNYFIQRHIGV